MFTFMKLQDDLELIDFQKQLKKFGLGKKVLNNFTEERSGVVPNTTWKKNLLVKIGI